MSITFENNLQQETDYRYGPISALEKNFPINENKLTSNDVYNLSIINATLTMINEKPDLDSEEQKLAVAGLTMERDNLTDKLVLLVARENLRDALMHPNENYTGGGIIQYSEILNKLKTSDKNEQESDYIDYEDILTKLISRLKENEVSKLDIEVALELSEKISRFANRKIIAEHCMDIFNNGGTTNNIERLLQDIHQGGYEIKTLSDEVERPLIENISDRPWEVANTLTFIFAGYTRLAEQKINESLQKYIKPNRELPIVKEYFTNKELDMRIISGATKQNKYLQAALSLTTKLPVTVIEEQDFFIDPFTAVDIIENRE